MFEFIFRSPQTFATDGHHDVEEDFCSSALLECHSDRRSLWRGLACLAGCMPVWASMVAPPSVEATGSNTTDAHDVVDVLPRPRLPTTTAHQKTRLPTVRACHTHASSASDILFGSFRYPPACLPPSLAPASASAPASAPLLIPHHAAFRHPGQPSSSGRASASQGGARRRLTLRTIASSAPAR